MASGNTFAWVLIALTCATLWGIGYTFLAPASKVFKPATVQTVFGFLLFTASLLVSIAQDGVLDFSNFTRYPREGIFCLLYICCFIVANWIQLKGYDYVTGNTGAYNAICSTYPFVVLVASFIFFNQRSLNMPYVIPGMLMIMGGVTILAVAPAVPAPIAAGGGAPAAGTPNP